VEEMIKKDIVTVIGIIGMTLLLLAVVAVGVLFVNVGIEHIVDHRYMTDRVQDVALGVGMVAFVAGGTLLLTAALLEGN
jgi:hypothetical protein